MHLIYQEKGSRKLELQKRMDILKCIFFFLSNMPTMRLHGDIIFLILIPPILEIGDVTTFIGTTVNIFL